MPVLVTTSLLLVASNVFMTVAWYAHLKNQADKPWWIAALVSWGIALLEYMLQVPANRIGYQGGYSLGQLKILQDAITLTVFVPFVLISVGEQSIDSALASILNATVPLTVIVLAPLFLADEGISVARVAGLALGFAGVILLVAPDLVNLSDADLSGELMMLGSSVSYGIGNVYARRNVRGLRPMIPALFQVGFAVDARCGLGEEAVQLLSPEGGHDLLLSAGKRPVDGGAAAAGLGGEVADGRLGDSPPGHEATSGIDDRPLVFTTVRSRGYRLRTPIGGCHVSMDAIPH